MATATATRISFLRRLSAIIAQVLSYLTTLGAAAHVLRPTDETMWAVTAGVALAFEILFMGMKETLFDGDDENNAIGWLGFGLDAVVNTGGALTFAGRILTFGPLAFMLGLFGVNVADPVSNLIGAFIISLVAGIALSVAPHPLWRPKRRKRRKDEE